MAPHLITKSLAQGYRMATGAMPAAGPVHEDYSTHYDGDITVQASDPLQMERALAARKRLKRLTNAGRTGH